MNLHPKVISSVSGSVVGGAITTLIVWLLSLKGVTPPPDVTDALTVLFGAILAFAAGYLTPSGDTSTPAPPAQTGTP